MTAEQDLIRQNVRGSDGHHPWADDDALAGVSDTGVTLTDNTGTALIVAVAAAAAVGDDFDVRMLQCVHVDEKCHVACRTMFRSVNTPVGCGILRPRRLWVVQPGRRVVERRG